MNWPFSDPENIATLTVKQIVRGELPILLVRHDADDGGWQFLTGRNVHTTDAIVVALREIVKSDPSIAELADLPEGWQASREFVGDPWKRTAGKDP